MMVAAVLFILTEILAKESLTTDMKVSLDEEGPVHSDSAIDDIKNILINDILQRLVERGNVAAVRPGTVHGDALVWVIERPTATVGQQSIGGTGVLPI